MRPPPISSMLLVSAGPEAIEAAHAEAVKAIRTVVAPRSRRTNPGSRGEPVKVEF
jgi:hypothetical protein